MPKPSPTQMHCLLTAVRNHGYLPAGHGVPPRTTDSCRRHGWLSADNRIMFAGRDAARLTDPDGYAAAVPTEHVDFELARVLGHPLPLPPGTPLKSGEPAPALAIPDGLVQYTVPAGPAAAAFVGYQVMHRGQLCTITTVTVHTDLAANSSPGCTLHVPDGRGGQQYAGTYFIEFSAYAPTGGPDLRSRAALALARDAQAAQDAQAAPFVDRIREIRQAAAAGTPIGLREAKQRALDEARHQAAEHEAADEDPEPAVEEITEALHALGKSGGVRNLFQEIMLGGRKAGSSFDNRLRFRPQVADPAAVRAWALSLPDATVTAGQARGMVAVTMAGFRPGSLTPLESAALAAGIPPATLRALTPGVHADALDANLGDVRRIQDELLRRLPGDEHRMLGTDPRGEGFRVRLYVARRTATCEAVRKALMFLELALHAFAADRCEGGERLLGKSAAALGI